ncbi:MAG: metal-dependent hydrolase [Planctomycetes bacterium]|nr:metal-dependent hydrolase [Planctomycetota bacterium]
MPDAITHLALVYPFRRLCPTRGQVAALYMGCILPDVCFKAFLYGFQSSIYFSEPTHSPLVLLAICYFFSLLFDVSERRRIFVILYLASVTHVLLDMLKNHLGQGVVPLLFPFSLRRYELSLFWPEDSVYVMLIALAAAAIVELALRVRIRQAKTAS